MVSRRTWINAALFQLTWLACVVGGAAGQPIWGGLALGVLAAHSLLEGRVLREFACATALAAVGLLLDTLWIRLGVLDYHGASFAPSWIVMLWMAVGLTLNHCLAMFAQRPWLGGILAGVCAPLSYLAGERLGAVVVPVASELLGIAVTWWVLFTLAFTLVGVDGPEEDERSDDGEHAH